MQQTPLIQLGAIPQHLEQAIGYPGEAQFVALIPGLHAELWFDDGGYTGLVKISLQQLLVQANIVPHATLFQKGHSHTSPTPSYWLLLDRQTLLLFAGAWEIISSYLHPT